MTRRSLRILFLVAEAVPFAKTGGLADVGSALPKALRNLGHDVRLAMPRYGCVDPKQFGLRKVAEEFPVPVDHGATATGLWQGALSGKGKQIPVYFVENRHLYERDGIYMYPDDAERFVFFCWAALEGIRVLGWRPDVVHAHDWHTALVPNWLHTTLTNDPFWGSVASVFTIHNLAYQGVFGHRVLEVAGLAEYGFLVHPDTPHLNDVVDFMARGIHYADIVTTVSPTYARQILEPEYGEGLTPLLRDRRNELFGVLDGIDNELFDPAADDQLPAHYSPHDLRGKVICKSSLQSELGLDVDEQAPVVGWISRLTDQKGCDLVAPVVERLLTQTSIQFILLGTGDEHYHTWFLDIQRRFPSRVSVNLTFADRLSRHIYAGSDLFVMPSRFEPCGLGQLVSMRYGTIPVVRATGGLVDTVEPWDPASRRGTGFTFVRYDVDTFYTTMVRALETYRYRPIWTELVRSAMTADFSWVASATQYLSLYRQAIDLHHTH